jgi:hypothetical protein
MLKKSLILVCLIFAQNTIANETLPPILDYHPHCLPVTLDNIAYNQSYLIESSSIDNNSELNQSLLHVRELAKTAGADAIIINNVADYSRTVKLKKRNKLSPTIIEVGVIQTKRSITINAEAIRFCEKDRRISAINTPFNSAGHKYKTTYTTKSPLPVNERQAMVHQAQDIESVDPTITLTSVFGVALGSTAAQLLEKLGPPSVKLTLDGDTHAWIYGRDILFILVNEIFVAANYGDLLLNSSGKNQIKYNHNYDDMIWNVLSKIHYKSELSLVQALLGENLIKEDEFTYYLRDNEQELQLRFESFISTSNMTPETKLIGFTLSSHKKHPLKNLIRFMPLNQAKLQALFSKGNSTLVAKSYINPKIENTFNFTQSGQWHMLTNNILIQLNNEEIDHVKLLSGLTTQEESTQSFSHLLNKLSLPSTKEDFMGKYPNAEDNFDSVIVSDDRYFIEAIFDSESNNAKLVELDIKYF